MRKMITALCVLAVAVGSMMAAANIRSAEKNNAMATMKMDNDPVVENANRYANAFTESAPFDQSANGYGWVYGYNRKIAWMPENNLYVSAYRKKSAAGTGAIGGMTGSWGDNIPVTISEHSSTMNCRYPSTAGIEKYGFAIFNHNAATPASAYIAVYDNDEESWTPPIGVKNADGTSLNEAWTGTGDITKDAQGNYRLLTVWDVDGLNNWDSKKIAAVVGKSSNPYDVNSWTWTDKDAMTAFAGAGGFNNMERGKSVWGKNGFGIVMVVAKETEDDVPGIFYVYTKDYGQTWEKNTAAVHGFFKANITQPYVGKYYASDAGDVLIENSYMFWNIDAFVDENNDVHILGKASAGSSSGVQTNLNVTTDGTTVGGYYMWTAKFDAQGNPEGTQWETDLVAQYVGFAETDNAPIGADGTPEYAEVKYVNQTNMSVNYCGNGTIVASWLDRSETDAMLASECATALGATWDAQTTFMCDPYVIVSTDWGKTWQYSNAELKRAHHIKVNTDQKIQEQGFSISRGVKTGETIELYAAYQKANYQAPGAPPVDDPAAYENNLHVMKLLINPVGIETQDVTAGKTVELAQNYPNPFNPTTAINFSLQTPANVKLSVFNAQGQEVANLINAKMASGAHTANFNAANLNSGVYFYKLSVDGQSAVKKMVLTK